ncbi:hypothetical protein SNEBB_007100 [Seison nebaliae]|nr:hypothetical protein SNEBB_007100 [Seison nebaliae]
MIYTLPEKTGSFHPVDYVIFAGILLVSSGIGVFYAIKARREKATVDNFLMAGREMGPIPVSLSLVASFMSAITVLGTPKEVYVDGMGYFYIFLCYFVIMALTARYFIPFYYHMNITSVYEYLERRFNKYISLMGSLLFITQMSLYMGVVLYAPALALSQVSNLNVWVSVTTIGCVCTLYTTIGGLKAVLWTDVFQLIMMLVGMLASVIIGVNEVGGINEMVKYVKEGGRWEFDNFQLDPKIRHSFWSLTIGGFFTWVSVYTVNQAQIQRYLCSRTVKVAQLAVLINLLGLMMILILTFFIGMMLFAYFRYCDPLLDGKIKKYDQIYPYFVMLVMIKVKGLPGLFLGCIFSAALSTLSSGINSLAAVVLEDIIKPFCCKNKQFNERTQTIISKSLAVFFGALCIALAAIASQLGSVLQAALAIFGVIGGPLLSLFLFGMLFPLGTTWGVFIGGLTSILFTFWVFIGAQINKPEVFHPPFANTGIKQCNSTMERFNFSNYDYHDHRFNFSYDNRPAIDRLYGVSYLHYGTIAVLVMFIVGTTVSLIEQYLIRSSVKKASEDLLILPLIINDFLCRPCRKTEEEISIKPSLKSDNKSIELNNVRSYTNEALNLDNDVQEESALAVIRDVNQQILDGIQQQKDMDDISTNESIHERKRHKRKKHAHHKKRSEL